MSSSNHKMIEFFCDNFNANQIFNLLDYVAPNFVYSSPMKDTLSFYQYSHYVAYLSNTIRFEASNISSDDDELFKVEFLLDIVDAQQGFTGTIKAVAEIHLKNQLVERLHIAYSGSKAEMEYMMGCAAGFKQTLLK